MRGYHRESSSLGPLTLVETAEVAPVRQAPSPTIQVGVMDYKYFALESKRIFHTEC